MTQPETAAVVVIQAFDAEIVRLWGERLGRLYPHPKDKVVAERWLAMGATLPMIQRVLRETLEKRHARQLTIPSCLSYFENMVRDAVTTEKEAPQEDAETARWRSRVQGWRKNPKLWIEDQWGSPPGTDGCRVPKRVLSTMGV